MFEGLLEMVSQPDFLQKHWLDKESSIIHRTVNLASTLSNEVKFYPAP